MLLPFATHARRAWLTPLPYQPSPLAARSVDCREAHGGMRCEQRMLTARNRRHIPACIRRLFGLDDAVDDKAFGELVAQARAPRADAPKGLIVQARRCAIAIAASEDALMLRSRRSPRTVDHYERRYGDYPRGTDRICDPQHACSCSGSSLC